MKWGVRRYQPYPTGKQSKPRSIQGIMAKRANRKVDKGFENWKINADRKVSAIDSGKKANLAKLAYDKDRTNKQLKTEYKDANKLYKKDLKSNTAYRKGAIKREVGQDLSRKYLSESKKIQKALSKDPNNRELTKQYNRMMDNYNIERSKARRAADVGAKRSRKIASLKRTRTMVIKGAATTVAVAAGTYAVNEVLKSQGKQGIDFQTVTDFIKKGKSIMDMAGYFY